MPEEDVERAKQFHDTVGGRLRSAREAAGLSCDAIASRTKIAERHLIAIEEGRFSDLPGRTYAVGFSRAYARAVGLDEAEIALAVREVLSESEDTTARAQPATFEPGDPARVPGSRVAVLAALGALAFAVLIFVLWRSYYVPAGTLPDLTDETGLASGAAQPAASATPTEAPSPAGAVVFTALEPDIWVKFYDASGQQLMQKQMAKGERYTVPPDADGPRIWTSRPDALEITIGGRKVAPLADTAVNIKDVPVTAAALLAREPAVPSPSPGVSGGAPAPPRAPAAAAPARNVSSAPAATRAPSPAPRVTTAPVASRAPKATPTPKASAGLNAAPAPGEIAVPSAAPSPKLSPVAAPEPVEPSTVSE